MCGQSNWYEGYRCLPSCRCCSTRCRTDHQSIVVEGSEVVPLILSVMLFLSSLLLLLEKGWQYRRELLWLEMEVQELEEVVQQPALG